MKKAAYPSQIANQNQKFRKNERRDPNHTQTYCNMSWQTM